MEGSGTHENRPLAIRHYCSQKQIYVVTGVTDNGLTSSVEVYDIASNS